MPISTGVRSSASYEVDRDQAGVCGRRQKGFPLAVLPAKPLHRCSRSRSDTTQLSLCGSHIAHAVEENRTLEFIEPYASKPLRWPHLEALIRRNADKYLRPAYHLTRDAGIDAQQVERENASECIFRVAVCHQRRRSLIAGAQSEQECRCSPPPTHLCRIWQATSVSHQMPT